MSKDTQAAFQPLRDVLKQIDDAGLPKPESPRRVFQRTAAHAGTYPVPNLAVSVCEMNYFEAIAKAMEEGQSERLIRLAGKLAYCTVMPKLTGAANIRDFIACVTNAMLLDVIPGSECTRLLYAAQVAHTALTKRPKKRGKSSLTSTAVGDTTKLKSTT